MVVIVVMIIAMFVRVIVIMIRAMLVVMVALVRGAGFFRPRAHRGDLLRA